MPPNNWQKVKDILEQAIQLAPNERPQFLDKACADDKTVRREVEELLSSYDESESFLETPAISSKPDDFQSGQIFAHYKILKTLGAGGMGKVYLAEDTKLDRRVAVKFLNEDFSRDAAQLKRFFREAKAVSALNHPNILTVFEIGETSGKHYIITEFIEGKTLREHISSTGKLDILPIAVQIAEALSAAHQADIIHRDIKPENVMIRADGIVKVLDFGLAKLVERKGEAVKGRRGENESISNLSPRPPLSASPHLTKTGMVMGTASYMSPEQARGKATDERTDIFSFGVMLYEMISGRQPFFGESTIDILSALINSEPLPLTEIAPDCPAELQNIVHRALRKNPDERYQTMKEMLTDLKTLKQELDFVTQLKHSSGVAALISSQQFAVTKKRNQKLLTAIAVGLFLSAVSGLFFYRHYANLNWARENVGRVGALAKEKNFFEAYNLALQIQNYLPKDETIKNLMPTLSDQLSVITEPAGAKVYLKRFTPDSVGNFPDREFIGTTPLEKMRIPRGSYVLYLEKDGFVPISQTISGMPENYWIDFNPPPIEIKLNLKTFAEVPDRMVFVPGGDYRLVGWLKPTSDSAKLDDFLIDKYEVTNREFKEFISAGGYYKKDFWKYPFVKDGKTINFEEAIGAFKDRTGLPAPRNWTNQNFPEGKAEHPVTELNWYEAAAYAEFRGKSLPTVYQWEKAARDGRFTQGTGEFLPWGVFQKGDSLMLRANVGGKETMPVDSFEFGMSSFGAYNMLGNAAEWCRNELTEGFATAGSSWGDPHYNFGAMTGFPPDYVSNKLGFRCVKSLGSQTGDSAIKDEQAIPVFKPSAEAEFQSWLAFYRYDKTPLDAKIIEVNETDEWRREKISFVGANEERALAYLYLPKNFKRPLQVIEYVPAGDVFGRFLSVPQHIETYMSAHIKAGRAVFAVVFKGFIERENPPDYKPPPNNSVKYREKIVEMATDLRRGLDYLETRDDIDRQKIIYWGVSYGAKLGLIFAAVENRYRVTVLMAVGLSKGDRNWLTEANQANFSPHIKVPKLMFNGRYDEQYSWKTEAEPLFKLLREPKHLELFEGGHLPPPEIAVPTIGKWLDENIGAAK